MSTTLPLAAGTGADTIGHDAPSMDEETFRSLYARIASPLRAYLLRLSGDPALSDDLLQDTFVRLLQGRVPPTDPVGQKRYLFRIATNLLHDHHRRWWRWGSELPELSVTGPGPEIDQRTDVRRVMALMKPRERQLLWLAYVEGFSHVEIAEIVGVRTTSVRPMLFRARLLARHDTAARATRPIAVWERFASIVGLVALVAAVWRLWPVLTASAVQVQQAWVLSQTTGLGVIFNSVALAAATLLAFLIWFGLSFVRAEV